ncbi:MAG: arsenate reductase ArsC [Rhodospirillales bacterium]|nr:MAG: arsenate reductase ArsC [Rhodospirillales bacterium]
MADRPISVLFLCTGNSARSVLAESILNRLGRGRFIAHSAGSQPTGRINPFALELLEGEGYPIGHLRSKSWDAFSGPDAPAIDYIVTVCDSAASEACPIWPGHPTTAHWGIPDPAAATGSDEDKRAAFRLARDRLTRRIEQFLALPLDSLDAESLRARLQGIGRIDDAAADGAGGAAA